MPRSTRPDRLHLCARHPVAAARIARHYHEAYGLHGRSRARRRDDGIVGRLHSCIPCDVRAWRPRRGDGPGLSAVPAHPDRARLRAGADRDFRRNRCALTGDALLAHTARRRSKGVLVASPANPTGTMMSREALARLIDGGGRRRHPLHLRRDLSRPRLCVSGGDRG